jgi:RNA polymerase sigma-70 factor (ECF subfamily)
VDLELNRLIKEAKNGNQEAFSTLVTKYKGHVFRHAYAVLNNHQDAEDVAQEAFVKAFLSLKKLDNEFAFVSWLTRIVSNLCYDKLKKSKNIKMIDSDEEKQEHLLNNRSTRDPADLRLIIREAMQTLTAEHRTVLVLRDIQGYSYEEIADIVNIPLGTVKSRINSARAALKKELSRGDENG